MTSVEIYLTLLKIRKLLLNDPKIPVELLEEVMDKVWYYRLSEEDIIKINSEVEKC